MKLLTVFLLTTIPALSFADGKVVCSSRWNFEHTQHYNDATVLKTLNERLEVEKQNGYTEVSLPTTGEFGLCVTVSKPKKCEE